MRLLSLCIPVASGVLVVSGCGPSAPPVPAPTPTPSPPPVPSPTPTPTPYVARKPMDTGMLFNGLQFKWNIETDEGETAADDREKDGSYRLELNLKIRTPRPAKTLEDLQIANPRIGDVLPSLPDLLPTARVSPDYGELYKRKMNYLQERLEKIEQILSRHNYYDCDTILELKHPETGRRALLVQGDMDVNVDGSDGDRNVEVDGSGMFFQPQTSYRWPKTTDRANPFIKGFEERIGAAEASLAAGEVSREEKSRLREEIASCKRNIADLKSASFLVSKADPSVVLPGFMIGSGGAKIGDYAVVVHGDKMYPAILGDAGPSYKVGEASLRLCNEINDTGTPLARPVSDLAVTYLLFPGSAEKKRSQPDLDRWHVRCAELLSEIGVTNTSALHRWENTVPPWPTPTPTPTPTPEPSSAGASPFGTPVVDVGSAPGPVVETGGTPAQEQTNTAPSPSPGL